MNLSELINYGSNKKRLDEIKQIRQNIIPFVGAGISKGCGLFTWRELINKIAVEYLLPDDIKMLEEIGDTFKYADKIIDAAKNSDMIMKKIRDMITDSNAEYNEVTQILVSSFSPMVITTNYDTLLEDASINSPLGHLKPLLPCLVGQMNEAIQINDRRLLKIHGSLEETQSFVFSTKQYKYFYGEKGKRGKKPLPEYLMKIFSSKKVLFVGCSMEKDYTLDILEECVQQNRSISHYAIVPYPTSHEEQIIRNRRFTELGIEAIYYPQGEFEAVNRLISYLSENNNFISAMDKILNDIMKNDKGGLKQLPIILSLLKESYYITATKFPQLLDMDNLKEDYYEEIKKSIALSEESMDTLLNICEKAFATYIRIGYVRCATEVENFFLQQFEDNALKENELINLLKKKWLIKQYYADSAEDNCKLINKLSDYEINEYANKLISVLQYNNGMNMSIESAYFSAKRIIEIAEDRLVFDTKIGLLRSIGAFCIYYADLDDGEKCLENCIEYIENNNDLSPSYMLFKAKCYNNLAIVKGYKNSKLSIVLELIEKDLFLKKKYGESDLFYSRSLNYYATVLKEIDPFKACEAYIMSANLKKNLIGSGKNDKQNKELIASWATTVFNIGLLAKDLKLYDLAYRIISIANEYRYKTVDYCNKDYCSSINVHAELELFVHSKQKLQWIIDGVESRVNLPEGFTNTMSHTWYICAYYYYIKKDYLTALLYVHKSLRLAVQKDAYHDIREQSRTKLLLGDINIELGKKDEKRKKEAVEVYKTIAKEIENFYGHDSFFLKDPYFRLMHVCDDKSEQMKYNKICGDLDRKYANKIMDVKEKLEKYLLELNLRLENV